MSMTSSLFYQSLVSHKRYVTRQPQKCEQLAQSSSMTSKLLKSDIQLAQKKLQHVSETADKHIQRLIVEKINANWLDNFLVDMTRYEEEEEVQDRLDN